MQNPRPRAEIVQAAGAAFLLALQMQGFNPPKVAELRKMLLRKHVRKFMKEVERMVREAAERYPDAGSGWTILWLAMMPRRRRR